MKKIVLFLALTLTSVLCIDTKAISVPTTNDVTVFLEHADECLAIIEKAAHKMEVKGVAIVVFIPGDVTKSWISKMKVVGALSNDGANYLAIAYSKAAEMAETYKNSSTSSREPKHGEYGYPGGIIKKVKSGYILTAFSGATGEQDAEAATEGIDWLYQQY